MNVSIVIPTFNGKQLLEQMLPVLYSALKKVSDYEIIIVDNGSTDLTYEYIKEQHKDVHILQLPYNTGFTGAVNAGINQAKGFYSLILNNDCFLNEDTLPLMIQMLEQYPKYFATQPIVYNNEKQIENIGFYVDRFVGKAFPVIDPHSGMINEQSQAWTDTNQYSYGLSATCLLINTQTLKDMGLFDEKFHSYLEDVDLSIRLIKAKKLFYPTLNAVCMHMHMSTSSQMGSYKEQHDFMNWIRIIQKHYSFHFLMKHFSALFMERLRNLSGLLKKTATIS